MSKNWVIAPFDSEWSEAWEKVWEFDRKHGLISIGWPGLGNVSNYTIDQLKEVTQAHAAHMLHKFYHAIKEGDRIVARYGRNRIVGVGTVTRTAYYEPEKLLPIFEELGYPKHTYPNHIDVKWDPEWLESDEIWDCGGQVFGFQTLHSISSEKLESLLAEDEWDEEENNDFEIEDDEFDDDIPPSKVEIVLEKYLEDFIVSNFDHIFGQELSLYTDEAGNPIGQQFDTMEVGRIDLLCVDNETNEFVVLELKRGRPADKVVGQLLRYIGWVSEKLCEEGQQVRGMVICKDSDKKLQYAIKPVPSISVKYFRVDFELGDEPFGES